MGSRGIWFLSVLVVMCMVRLNEAKRGVIVTAPQTWLQARDEKICVSFHDIDFDVATQTVITQKSQQVLKKVNFKKGTDGCFSMRVDTVPDKYSPMSLNFTARGDKRGVEYEFNDTVEIQVQESGATAANVTFVELDKPKYKPGDQVRFRVLTIQEELKPRLENMAVVYVTNPSGVRMIQWRDVNVEATQGIGDFQFELSEDPMKGKWKINVQRDDGHIEVKAFSVEEYVLPKYEVTITPPVYVPINAQSVDAQVCAKYTYGEPVKGNLTVSMCMNTPYYYYDRRQFQCQTISTQISGCHTLGLPVHDLLNHTNTPSQYGSYNYYGLFITVNASVEEEGTGIVLNSTANTPSLGFDVYKVEFGKDMKKYFKPGLPYNGKILVTKPDGSPASDVEVTVQCSQHNNGAATRITTNGDGHATFIWTDLKLGEHENHISIKANIKPATTTTPSDPFVSMLREPSETFTVKAWFSPSDSYLVIDDISAVVDCNGTVNAHVAYNQGHSHSFHYQLTAQYSIIEEGQVQHTHGSAGITLSLVLPPGVWGDSALVVYYVRHDGEIVADSAAFRVNHCVNNKVSMSFSQSEIFPGRDVNLAISAAPGSMCAYGVVDASVKLLGGDNSVSMDQVLGRVPEKTPVKFGRYGGHDNEYCDKKLEEQEKEEEEKKKEASEESERERKDRERKERRGSRRGRGRGRRPRSIMPWHSTYSRYVDASEAFKTPSLAVLSDLTLDSRPCERQAHPPFEVYYSAIPEGAIMGMPGPVGQGPQVAFDSVVDSSVAVANEVEEPEVVVDTIRTFFPETWLWKLTPVDGSGTYTTPLSAPDTITEWTGHALCSHGNAGLGISAPATLKTFQPFFVSFTLPYSVIRGETLLMPVSVFNYLTECLVVELVLAESADFELAQGSRSTRLCVCGQEKQTHKFPITASKLGDVNVTVKAESVSAAAVCGNVILSNQVGVRDQVTRQLLVEPEGKEQVYSYSAFVCPRNGAQQDKASLQLPSGAVMDSARGHVTVMGDVMGPALSGLDKLIRLPTGCGEQTMLSFAPNVYILQYLQNTQQLTTATEGKTLKYLRSGYQREMTYRHPDGSYSAFGTNDDSGSTWLSAFVLKSFSQAAAFVDIDESDLEITRQWFRNNQRENGCYTTVGRVIHKSMQGGLQSGDSATPLTAYVMAALLEAKFDPESFMVTGAVDCLGVQTISDVYTTALVAYALSMWNRDHSLTQTYISQLRDMKTEENGFVYWSADSSSDHGATSVAVETTAYALMALLASAQDPRSELSEVLPVVRWLTAQRNPEGGFRSTQDTVVGLQALASFASVISQRSGDFSVTVQQSVTRDEFVFSVTPDNQMVLQREPVAVPNNLTFVSSGDGCALIQASLKYNIRDVTEGSKPSIHLAITPQRTPDNNCRQRDLKICVRYEGPDDKTNMALLDVKMVSGWVPIKETVDKLMQDTMLNLGRVELDKKNVYLYFNELPRDSLLCASFRVEEEVEVRDAKPGNAAIFDYYDSESVFFQKPYILRSICGTKEELPLVAGPEPFDVNNIEQRRQPDPVWEPVPEEESAGCAECMEGDVDQEELKDLLCTAKHVYKGIVKKRGEVKVQKDLTLTKKAAKVNMQVKVTEEQECTCGLLSKRGSHVLIITMATTIEETSKKKGALLITGDDKVYTTERKTKAMEKMIKKVKKSKRCRT